MAKGLGQGKRQAWVARLERFRASGLTIAKFCEEEQVSVQTYYYWVRRLGASSLPDCAVLRDARRSPSEKVASDARVHFQFGSGMEISMPADCLEAFRCLAQCMMISMSAPPVPFHQVLVRDAAQEAG